MKQNITSSVVQCKKCLKFYTEGVEGDDGICDVCFDQHSEFVEETFDPYDTYLDEEQVSKEGNKPNLFTEGDCV